MPQSRSLKTLEIILSAAETLMARQGLNSLTMDAVAAEAGISKGGVAHHFRSQEELIAGLVSRKTKSIREGSEAEERAMEGHPQATLLGMIRHSARQYGDEAGFPPALLIAATQDSESLNDIKDLLEEKLTRIRASGPHPDDAAMLIFATLGLLLSRTLGLSTLADEDARDIFDAIERAARRLD